MIKWFLAFVLLVAGVVGALYYWLYRPQEASLATAKQEMKARDDEIGRLKNRVEDLEMIRGELERAGSALQKQIADKEAEMKALRSTQDELVSELKQEIDGHRIEVQRIRDKLRVEMVDEVLFDSGEAALKPEGVAVLRKIGAVLKKAGDREIEIQGHTDNVPIRGALAKRFATNWELSAARAINVARYLQEQAGLDPNRLAAHAFSEYRPRMSNDSEEGRRKNRRIEIVLGPIALGRIAENEPSADSTAAASSTTQTAPAPE